MPTATKSRSKPMAGTTPASASAPSRSARRWSPASLPTTCFVIALSAASDAASYRAAPPQGCSSRSSPCRETVRCKFSREPCSIEGSGFAGLDHGRDNVVFNVSAGRPGLDELAAFGFRRDADINKSGARKPTFNALRRRSTRNAAAQQRGIRLQLDRQRSGIDDVRHGEPPGALEDAKGFAE